MSDHKTTVPKLSIIVPVYQAEAYLNRCIDSILNQSMTDFEIILVNDGSTDRSEEICRNYALEDTRVKATYKKNAGQAAARNDGINMARGKYIGFVDNDDEIMPDMYELLIRNIENADADISGCSFIQKNDDGTVGSRNHTYQKLILNNHEIMREFLSRTSMNIYIWTKIYRKDFLAIRNVRFENGKTDEDFLFNFEAFRFAKQMVMEDVPKYIYYSRSDSACRTFPKQNLKKYVEMTLYRTDKILNGVEKDYPDLTFLAKQQKLIYCITLLAAVAEGKGKSVCPSEYKKIMLFLKANARQLFHDRRRIGVTPAGIVLIKLLPGNIYYYYRVLKDHYLRLFIISLRSRYFR